jgi:hypothetical protein
MFQARVRGDGITLQKNQILTNLNAFITINTVRFPLWRNKTDFLSLIRHFFQETGWTKALPYIFG